MKCQSCHKNEATTHWVGEGSVMDFVHGGYGRKDQQEGSRRVVLIPVSEGKVIYYL